MPLFVIMAVISSDGVTSNAGFNALEPGEATKTFFNFPSSSNPV